MVSNWRLHAEPGSRGLEGSWERGLCGIRCLDLGAACLSKYWSGAAITVHCVVSPLTFVRQSDVLVR